MEDIVQGIALDRERKYRVVARSNPIKMMKWVDPYEIQALAIGAGHRFQRIGAIGDGNGITKKYGMGATPTYHDDRLRQIAEGEIYQTITNGKNNMLSYADKLVPADRWAVIAYVRALQRAQTGTAADVPAAHKSELGLK